MHVLDYASSPRICLIGCFSFYFVGSPRICLSKTKKSKAEEYIGGTIHIEGSRLIDQGVEESEDDIEPEFRRMLQRMHEEEKKLRDEKFKVLKSGIKLEEGQSSKGDGNKRKRRL
ncbi:hypothetical protein YC2023_013965 [Brassica napus]